MSINAGYMYTFRYAFTYITIAMFIVAAYFTGCSKEVSENPGPVMEFKNEYGYVFSDTTLRISDTIVIGIYAVNNVQSITQFRITKYVSSGIEYVDSGINTHVFEYERRIIKGIDDSEKWVFTLRDRDGKKDSITLTLLKDTMSEFGLVNRIEGIVLGAQNNNSVGSFYSFESAQVYSQLEANENQNKIDLLYFYDYILSDENTISSPGANIDISVYPETYSPLNWLDRNTTRFVSCELSQDQFNNSDSDSLILANTFEFMTGKRKCKNLTAGDVYAFILNNDGKKGLLRINSVEGTDAGFVNFDVLIQR